MGIRVDVRRFVRPDQPQPVYKGALTLWEAPLYVPIGRAQASERTRARAVLDVTTHTWIAPNAWILTNLPAGPTVAQIWPALQQASSGYRAGSRATLDVRDHVSDSSFGVPDDASVAQQAGIWALRLSTRTADRAKIDVRSFDSKPQDGWLFAAQPSAVTVAQTWPAILQGLAPSYRSGERSKLDVRLSEWAPESGWMAKAADAVVAKWAPVFASELRSGRRTADRATLDVRSGTAMPESTFTSTLPVVVFNPFWAANSNRTVGFGLSPQ